MPRFAILRHDSPRGLHWDFFLEVGAALRSWALDEAPADGRDVLCQSLTDHRTDYLSYEGLVSRDRGSVIRWDGGDYTLVTSDDDLWIISLHGQWLRGTVTLRRVPGTDNWRFVFAAD